MIPLFILCLLQDTSGALKGPRLVTGNPGGMVTIKCHYTPTPVNKYQRKYWCRLYPPQRLCHTVVSTNFFISQSYRGRVTLLDFPSSGMFVVTLGQLAPEDTGYYRCGIGPRTDTLFFSMNLTVSTAASVNHSLDSAILTIPSSIIPTVTLATRGQIMETLGTSTVVKERRQELDRALPSEGWGTRMNRRDTTTPEVSQAPETIRTTTGTGGHELGTRTSRRDATGGEITEAPGIIKTTTVTGGHELDTTLLVEGWETRTNRRHTTTTEVSQAPETIRTPTGTGGHELDTRTSRRDATGGEVTEAPGIIKTTIVTGGHELDTTLLVEGWETKTSRSDTTPSVITQARGTTGATALEMGGQIPKAMETTSSSGGQIFDETLVLKGQGTGISRDLTLVRVTQLPAQASSKNIQSLGTVRLPDPGTGDWDLETIRAANLVPEGQTSGAKAMEYGSVLGTRAVTRMIVGTLRERRSTIRSTERLTEGTVNIGIPLITTINSPGIIRPSTVVRDGFREVTPGTDQQTQGISRATTPAAGVGASFSGTFRKGPVSGSGGTAAIGRESHSEEPLRRIPGAALPIPSSSKPFLKNSSPDERRVSQILITVSTVLLPLVLLVLLLLLKKLQRRVSLRTQKPTFPLIQLTNFETLPEKLSLEALLPQEASLLHSHLHRSQSGDSILLSVPV